MPKGDCYMANGRFVMRKMNEPDENKWRLCHGVGILLRDGKPFGHCWAEKGNMVHDESNGNDINLDKRVYYAIGNIPVKGYKIYKYNLKINNVVRYCENIANQFRVF